MPKTDWEERARLLRQSMKDEQPPIQIEKVMEVFNIASKGTAEYALIKLSGLGVVKWVAGKWYLV